MPRRVEDILPNERRSIRNVSVGSGEIKLKKTSRAPISEEVVPIHRIPTTPPVIEKVIENKSRSHSVTRKRFGTSKKIMVVLGGLVALVVIGYFASTYFSRAVFTVTPRTVTVNINSSYVASNVPKEGLLTYKIVKSDSYSSTTVPATDGASLSAKAQGTLTIYNAYAPTARKLIAGTRFASPNGRVYRIPSTIMIPGFKTSSSGAITPGSIKSVVIADQFGTEYNVDKTSIVKVFKVVAYEGGDKYDKIYGELATSIKGGASGNKKVIDPAILASATASLKAGLTGELGGMIKNQLPADYFMFDNGTLTFETEISNSVPKEAIVTVHGIIYGLSIKKSELVAKLAGQAVVDTFAGLSFDPIGLDQLSYSLSNQKDFSPDKGGVAVIQLKGPLTLKGNIPVEELKTKFAGKALLDTAQILRSYSPIIDLTKSSGQVVPPWSKIPTNTSKISIIVQ